MENKLAILGGNKTVTLQEPEANSWSVFGGEEYCSVKRVMSMSDYSFYEEAYQLEREVKEFFGVGYALPHINVTASIH